MRRLIDFAKIQAAGNDFVLIGGDTYRSKHLNAPTIRAACDRHLGIGGDGLIVISRLKRNSIKMSYYNADGSEGEMCGNGLRASVLYSYILGMIQAKKWFNIKARDGTHRAIFHSPDNIIVEVKVQDQLRSVSRHELGLGAEYEVWGFINTGVPHLVLGIDAGFETLDVFGNGKKLRNHLMFKKEGTNVNFVNILGKNQLRVRTYERGVESETLSCGTGVTACALTYWHLFASDSKQVEIITRGGRLNVFRENGRYFLQGPARIAFIGQYLL